MPVPLERPYVRDSFPPLTGVEDRVSSRSTYAQPEELCSLPDTQEGASCLGRARHQGLWQGKPYSPLLSLQQVGVYKPGSLAQETSVSVSTTLL
ncbi:hypothetical protein Y1Q_0016751 [Alligator mississippiensis]|uniref:Uncharacterized protein n=1 Tax=Alligator mississippiensis TaxID=8496 RepID=A0A151P5V5_ALLMI|nr:hypothetical protein Y1Q_0016751 [Alligator mississippiensis]